MARKIINLPLDQIKPYERNPRINDAAVHDVAQSIMDCGYQQLILVDEDNVILCGHTRLKALHQLGYQSADVQVAEGLTDKQKRMYRLLDNRTNERATWDKELAALEAEDLDFSDYDLDFDFAQAADALDLDLDTDDNGGADDDVKVMHCPKCGFVFEVRE